MTSEQIEAYKDAMLRLARAASAKELDEILSDLTNLRDDAPEIRDVLHDRSVPVPVPAYWIGILRVLKFCIVVKVHLLKKYDEFVSTHQALKLRSGRSEDEGRLMEELGGFLYRLDDIGGRYDRFSPEFIAELNRRMVESYGRQFEANDDFYRGRLREDSTKHFRRSWESLMELCFDLLELEQTMESLDRLSNLIAHERKGEGRGP